MTTIDRRIAALEKEAGDPAKHHYLVVTFPDSEKLATGLDPIAGSHPSLPSLDRLPGESWEALKARADVASAHLPAAVYLARAES